MVESGAIVDAKSILGILWLDRLHRAEAEGADRADGAGSSNAAAGAASPPTTLRYGFTPTQFALANARFVRSRPGVRVIGLGFVVIGLLNLLLGPDAWIWGTCLVGGMLFLTGVFAIPFALLAHRKRRHLLANLEFAFDERGIQSVGIASESEIRWAGIDRITRNGPYLFVRFVAGSTILVPVAAFQPEQLDAFGRVALRNGLTLDGHRVDIPAEVIAPPRSSARSSSGTLRLPRPSSGALPVGVRSSPDALSLPTAVAPPREALGNGCPRMWAPDAPKRANRLRRARFGAWEWPNREPCIAVPLLGGAGSRGAGRDRGWRARGEGAGSRGLQSAGLPRGSGTRASAER